MHKTLLVAAALLIPAHSMGTEPDISEWAAQSKQVDNILKENRYLPDGPGAGVLAKKGQDANASGWKPKQ